MKPRTKIAADYQRSMKWECFYPQTIAWMKRQSARSERHAAHEELRQEIDHYFNETEEEIDQWT